MMLNNGLRGQAFRIAAEITDWQVLAAGCITFDEAEFKEKLFIIHTGSPVNRN